MLHDAAGDGAAAARPVDQRDGDVPRPELLPGVPRARRAAAADLSVHPHLARRLFDGRRSLLDGDPARGGRAVRPRRASTRPTSTKSCCSRREAGIFPLERMQEYTENYIRAGGKRSFSEYYTAKYDGALFNPSLTRERRLLAAQPRHRPLVQRVQRHPLPQRADLLRRDAAGPRARAVLRQPRRCSASSRWAARSRCGSRSTRTCYEQLDPSREDLPEGAMSGSWRTRSSSSERRGAGSPRCAQLVGGLPADFRHAGRRRAAPPQATRTTCSRTLLQDRDAALRVCEVEDKMPIERGHVYVAPADYHLLVERGLLLAARPTSRCATAGRRST